MLVLPPKCYIRMKNRKLVQVSRLDFFVFTNGIDLKIQKAQEGYFHQLGVNDKRVFNLFVSFSLRLNPNVTPELYFFTNFTVHQLTTNFIPLWEE